MENKQIVDMASSCLSIIPVYLCMDFFHANGISHSTHGTCHDGQRPVLSAQYVHCVSDTPPAHGIKQSRPLLQTEALG